MAQQPLPAASHRDHLNDVIGRAGLLGGGSLRDVEVLSARNTVLSRIFRLRLVYDSAAADAPATLILKTGLAGRAGATLESGHNEVAFYAGVAAATPAGLLPYCLDAAWDAATRDWHLLLEDLTDSHFIATAWPLPPAEAQCALIVSTLARFHAAWWDDARLGTEIGIWLDEQLPKRLGDFADRFAGFADQLGDRLTPERRQLYERFMQAAPRLAERYRARRNMTVAHGDAHVWNCLIPKQANNGDARLFDWDAWHIDLATDDLAYMMAMHWYPDRRARLERSLLDRYHATLVARGVAGYDRAALQADYRLSVLWQIRRPLWQMAVGIPPVIWWNNFERIMLAVDDLGCAELLA